MRSVEIELIDRIPNKVIIYRIREKKNVWRIFSNISLYSSLIVLLPILDSNL